jgi:hypothetical protein
VSAPYRGFVELPKAVFDDLKKMGETIVEEAVKKAQPKTGGAASLSHLAPMFKRAYSERSLTETVEYVMRRVVRDFEVQSVDRAQFAAVVRVWARHTCGALAKLVFDERTLLSCHKDEMVRRLVRKVDEELVCYCVPRDLKPMHSAMFQALQTTTAKPVAFLFSQVGLMALNSEALHDSFYAGPITDGCRFMGVPIRLDVAVEIWELQTEPSDGA